MCWERSRCTSISKDNLPVSTWAGGDRFWKKFEFSIPFPPWRSLNKNETRREEIDCIAPDTNDIVGADSRAAISSRIEKATDLDVRGLKTVAESLGKSAQGSDGTRRRRNSYRGFVTTGQANSINSTYRYRITSSSHIRDVQILLSRNGTEFLVSRNDPFQPRCTS